MVSVESTNIVAIGYGETRLSLSSKSIPVLRVQFNNGIYDYYNVSKEVYEDFLKAESKGSYFHKNINKKYDFEKIK